MNKDKLFEIIEDLLRECYFDCYEYNDEEITDKEADLIYNNVKLFTKKLKDKIKESE